MQLNTLTSTVLLATLVGSVVLTGCTGGSGAPELKKEPNIELIQDMMDQPSLKAQDYEPGNPTKAGARIPPENTVPIGYKPYAYSRDPVGAQKNLKNPLSGDMSPQVVDLGRKKYEIYCAVCHGYQGAGDGPVAPKMALKPPALISEKITTMNDGGIYHIITDGQGVMSSYAYQLVEERDRWAIVNYVRSLQKLAKGSGAPLPPGGSGQ